MAAQLTNGVVQNLPRNKNFFSNQSLSFIAFTPNLYNKAQSVVFHSVQCNVSLALAREVVQLAAHTNARRETHIFK